MDSSHRHKIHTHQHEIHTYFIELTNYNIKIIIAVGNKCSSFRDFTNFFKWLNLKTQCRSQHRVLNFIEMSRLVKVAVEGSMEGQRDFEGRLLQETCEDKVD